MIRCRRAAELMSQRLDAPLPLWRRVVLAVHTFACGKCRRYGQQVTILEAVAGELLTAPLPADARLSPAARERITARVRAACLEADSPDGA